MSVHLSSEYEGIIMHGLLGELLRKRQCEMEVRDKPRNASLPAFEEQAGYNAEFGARYGIRPPANPLR